MMMKKKMTMYKTNRCQMWDTYSSHKMTMMVMMMVKMYKAGKCLKFVTRIRFVR